MADEVEDAVKGELVRVVLPLDRDPGERGPEDEWIWAEPLGSGRYRVESAPFFAYGLSREDVVRAIDGELPRVEDVERKGGHRTLRVALDPAFDVERAEVRTLFAELEGLGCALETLPPHIAAVDVPPELDVAEVVRRLQVSSRDGVLIWEWADPRPS
jgi:hypothetical protein